MSGILDELLEMGFSKERIEIAISETKGVGLQEAMDWLISHDQDQNQSSASESNPDTVVTETPKVMSMKCDDCGKLLRDSDAVEFHAAKTNHANYSESTEEIKPMTEEEKKAKLLELQELIKIRREKRQKELAEEELEKEKRRREDGKGLREIKEIYGEKERQKELEEQRRAKMEDKLLREQIKQRIARERAERSGQPHVAPPVDGGVEPKSNQSAATSSTTAVDRNTCRIQIRLSDGRSLPPQQFGAQDCLSAVRDFIVQHRGGDGGSNFILKTTFPNRRYGSEDMGQSLAQLGLVPSAVILVQDL